MLLQLRNLPLEFRFGQRCRFGKPNFDAVAGCFDVADIDHAGQCRRPESRQRAAAGVEREEFAGALVVPSRRHHPGIFAVEIAFLRTRRGGLIPRMPLIDRIAQRIVLDEALAAGPVVVERAAEKDADVRD